MKVNRDSGGRRQGDQKVDGGGAVQGREDNKRSSRDKRGREAKNHRRREKADSEVGIKNIGESVRMVTKRMRDRELRNRGL